MRAILSRMASKCKTPEIASLLRAAIDVKSGDGACLRGSSLGYEIYKAINPHDVRLRSIQEGGFAREFIECIHKFGSLVLEEEPFTFIREPRMSMQDVIKALEKGHGIENVSNMPIFIETGFICEDMPIPDTLIVKGSYFELAGVVYGLDNDDVIAGGHYVSVIRCDENKSLWMFCDGQGDTDGGSEIWKTSFTYNMDKVGIPFRKSSKDAYTVKYFDGTTATTLHAFSTNSRPILLFLPSTEEKTPGEPCGEPITFRGTYDAISECIRRSGVKDVQVLLSQVSEFLEKGFSSTAVHECNTGEKMTVSIAPYFRMDETVHPASVYVKHGEQSFLCLETRDGDYAVYEPSNDVGANAPVYIFTDDGDTLFKNEEEEDNGFIFGPYARSCDVIMVFEHGDQRAEYRFPRSPDYS